MLSLVRLNLVCTLRRFFFLNGVQTIVLKERCQLYIVADIVNSKELYSTNLIKVFYISIRSSSAEKVH